jgi:hypothetical protein
VIVTRAECPWRHPWGVKQGSAKPVGRVQDRVIPGTAWHNKVARWGAGAKSSHPLRVMQCDFFMIDMGECVWWPLTERAWICLGGEQ